MVTDAPALLVWLEGSGLGQGIRQSVWIYAAANIAHVVALALFAGAVAIMDLRLLGAFSGTRPRDVIGPAQTAAMMAFGLLVATGFLLFTAEASHVAANRVFLIKMALVGLGLLNALLLRRPLARALASMDAGLTMPSRFRISAAASLLVWLLVATCGRLIAYV